LPFGRKIATAKEKGGEKGAGGSMSRATSPEEDKASPGMKGRREAPLDDGKCPFLSS